MQLRYALCFLNVLQRRAQLIPQHHMNFQQNIKGVPHLKHMCQEMKGTVGDGWGFWIRQADGLLSQDLSGPRGFSFPPIRCTAEKANPSYSEGFWEISDTLLAPVVAPVVGWGKADLEGFNIHHFFVSLFSVLGQRVFLLSLPLSLFLPLKTPI